jgi:hypothetical protein
MRRETVRRIAHEKLGLKSDIAIARALHVDQGDMSRYLHGRRQPHTALVASVMDLLDEKFETLFEVQVVADPAPRFANAA